MITEITSILKDRDYDLNSLVFELYFRFNIITNTTELKLRLEEIKNLRHTANKTITLIKEESLV